MPTSRAPQLTAPTNRCRGCSKPYPTPQGLKGHYTRNPLCREESTKRLTAHLLAHQPRADNAPIPHDTPHDSLPEPFHNDYHPAPTIPAKRHRVTVENITEEEDDDPTDRRAVDTHPTAAESLPGTHATSWNSRKAADEHKGCKPWAPFESLEEWGHARWMMKSGLSQKEMDEYLKLQIVSFARLSSMLSPLIK